MYDIAYLDYFSTTVLYGDLWLAYARDRDLDVPYFEERIRCYMLRIGLGDLLTYSTTGNHHNYIRAWERTWSVLAPGRRRPTDWTQ